MAEVVINRSNLTDIADAIRDKNGQTTATYKPSEMAEAISEIQTYKPEETFNVTPSTSAQIITPSEGYVFSSGTVQAMPTGTATTPATTKQQSAPTFTQSGNVVTANVAATSVDVTPTISAGYVSEGTSGTITMSSNSAQYTIPSGTISTTEGSISGTTYTQGKVIVDTDDAGYIAAGDKVSGATFANTSTSGTTYKDISSTTAAPVLVSGDYLYINKGYTDDVKISLAKLAPDEGSADLASSHILQGYSAYNNDGQLIAGSIPTKTSSDLTASGATVTVPVGYYASAATKSIDSGSATTPATTKQQSAPTFTQSGNVVTANVAATSVDVTPTVSAGYVSEGTTGTVTLGANSATYTIPTGTATTPATTKAQSTPTMTGAISGSNYVVTATVAATSVSVTPTVSAGYVSAGTAGTITMTGTSNTFSIPVYDGSIS